jgi:predicted transposase/invertase (TIGR01784 family)
LLFSDPDILRELYGTLEGVSLPTDVPITINTLQNALFQNRINDISFEIGGKLIVLIEHQSSLSPNMALRLLMYIARIYEKIIVNNKSLYTTQLIRIPRPEFFVLYNGKKPFPDEQTFKLSDTFENPDSLGVSEKETPALELVVKVININHGKNEAMVQKCKTLAQYSAFIAKSREFEREYGSREEGLKRAVIYCRDNDILRKFLEEHGTEVLNMLFAEWNQEDALAVHYAEGREEGREEIARNALAKRLSPELIHSITGLDLETIISLGTNPG